MVCALGLWLRHAASIYHALSALLLATVAASPGTTVEMGGRPADSVRYGVAADGKFTLREASGSAGSVADPHLSAELPPPPWDWAQRRSVGGGTKTTTILLSNFRNVGLDAVEGRGQPGVLPRAPVVEGAFNSRLGIDGSPRAELPVVSKTHRSVL